MVKLFIYSMLALLGGLYLAIGLDIANDPGYLFVSFKNITFETSLFAFVVLLVFIFGVVRLLLVLIRWINPMNLVSAGKSFSRSRLKKNQSKTAEGLISLSKGRWSDAYTTLLKNANEPTATVYNFLAAAEAAYELGDKELWLDCLEQAEKKYPNSIEAINVVKARLYFNSGQLEQCLALLIQLRKSAPKDPYLLTLHKEVSIALRAWPELKLLLPELSKENLLDSDELLSIERRLLVEDLSVAGAEVSGKGQTSTEVTDSKQESTGKSVKNRLASLKKRWKQVPARYRDDEKIVSHYVSELRAIEDGSVVAKTIEDLLNKHWNDDLVVSYGLVESADHKQQLIHGENWLKKRPGNSQLLMTLGRLSLRNELWGKARDYLQASVKIAPSAEVYAELSRLSRNLALVGVNQQPGNDQIDSGEYFDQYLMMRGQELPLLPMPGSMDEVTTNE